jgi:hypothetical protein
LCDIFGLCAVTKHAVRLPHNARGQSLRQHHSRTTIAARKRREKIRVALGRTLERALNTSLIRHQLSSYPYHPSLARVRSAKVFPRAARFV